MSDYTQYLAFQIKAVMGAHRPAPLLSLHLVLSLIGGVLLTRIQQFWGEFAFSYAVFLMTALWFMDTLFGAWQAARERCLSPGALSRGLGKWLLWVSILFVAYALPRFDPVLNLVGHTIEMAVLLTQGLYVVRSAARLLDNPLATRVLSTFEGRLERQLNQVLDEVANTKEKTDNANAELTELREQRALFEARLAALEQNEGGSQCLN